MSDCSPPESSAHGISRQEYWSFLPYPTPGDLPDAGIESMSLASPALAGRFFTTSATWEALTHSGSGKILFSDKLGSSGSPLWQTLLQLSCHQPPSPSLNFSSQREAVTSIPWPKSFRELSVCLERSGPSAGMTSSTMISTRSWPPQSISLVLWWGYRCHRLMTTPRGRKKKLLSVRSPCRWRRKSLPEAACAISPPKYHIPKPRPFTGKNYYCSGVSDGTHLPENNWPLREGQKPRRNLDSVRKEECC